MVHDNDSSDDLVEYHESSTIARDNSPDGTYHNRNGHLPWSAYEGGMSVRDNKVVTKALIESIPGRIGALRTDSLDESVTSNTINALELDDSEEDVFSLRGHSEQNKILSKRYSDSGGDEMENTALLNGLIGSKVEEDDTAPIVHL